MIGQLRVSAIYAIASVIIVVGCKEDAAHKEETHTVDWYLENEVEREKKLSECGNNPGVLNKTPNCVNALQAAHVASSGSDIDWEEFRSK